ncbi:D-glycero-alpha-D-manno-heptose-1,7-bisphosphate 7-phosphatase [Ideonella sp.]|uniref:D-glycero-alpha-D-manno-heptose-1,7-bisphosphate 7-phosphatase n=1 Tax=Ideonella sp. TaxID=1929293 RepID=UPI0035B32498
MSPHRTVRPAERPAVFIDKDGTLVENVPWNVDPAELRLMPGAAEALQALACGGFALVVVTNQSGLAEGRFSAAQFASLRAALRQMLRERGVTLTDFLHCPHAASADGRPACLCRKPQPGMLHRAARLHGLDLARSWMVGDILDDVEAGRRAGCRSILLDSGGETVWRRTPLRVADHRVDDWIDVAERILGDQRRMPNGLTMAGHG